MVQVAQLSFSPRMIGTSHKRSIALVGHKTSVSLEDQFWNGLHEIAESQNIPMTALVGRINANRTVHNLSSALRLFVLAHAISQQIFPNARPNPRTDAAGVI